MGNSCNQIPTLSNTAEIVEIKKSFRTTPLLSSSFEQRIRISTFIVKIVYGRIVLMKKLILFATIFFISSCVSYGPTLQQKINAYIGYTESTLISNFGIPTRTYSTDNGFLYMEYTQSNSGSTVRQGTNDSLYSLPGYCTQYYCPPRQSSVTNYTNWCTVTFVLNQKKVVVNGAYRGNSC